MKCRECGYPTKNKEDDICFNCSIIITMIKEFERGILLHSPIVGKKRKLEIISYKITRQ